jgi:acetyltransferase-like isoleucine patch superfamily enzyme
MSWQRAIRRWLLRVFREDSIPRWRSLGAKIGDRVFIGSEVTIDESFASWLTIEDDVVIASRTTIICHDSALTNLCGLPVKVGYVTIGNMAYIGANCTILCGVSIGSQALVGAGSLVTKDIPPGMVAFGVPAVVRGTVEEFRQRFESEMHDTNQYQYLDILPWRDRQAGLNRNEINKAYRNIKIQSDQAE